MKNKKYLIKSDYAEDFFAKKHVFQTIKDNVTFEASSFYQTNTNRYDLCVSSMAGCLNGCKICQCTYANSGYERNLSSSEITDQIDFLINDGRNLFDENTMVLVVFMGNGDPLQNVKEVIDAITLTHQKYGKLIYRFGISTIGVNLDCLQQFADISLKYNIAIWLQYSMVSIDDNVRRDILPLSQPLFESIPYLDFYAERTGNPTRYNFPMIEGINDSTEHLIKIIRFVQEKPQLRMIKLSTYNEISSNQFRPCSYTVLTKASEYLRERGVRVDLFFSHNDLKLHGSCGQMRELPIIIKDKHDAKKNDSKHKILLFTHNPNKLFLAKTIGKRFNVDISDLNEISSSYVDHVEKEGITYLDRALLKAKMGYKLANLPCIATDFGMEILSLSRKPGIETEHWMNSVSDDELIKITIMEISKLHSSQRRCEFVGVGVMMVDDSHYLFARESDIGILLTSPIGPIIKGHPLSSLLYLPDKGKTLAELFSEEFPSKDVRIYEKLLGDFIES